MAKGEKDGCVGFVLKSYTKEGLSQAINKIGLNGRMCICKKNKMWNLGMNKKGGIKRNI